MKNLFFTIIFLALVSLFFVFPSPSFAGFPIIHNPVLSSYESATDPQTYFNKVIAAIISLFFIVGIIYFFWHVIFAGYHLIGSDGDPKKYETAKNELTYSVLGVIVVFSIFAIVKLVGTVLDIASLKDLWITWPHL